MSNHISGMGGSNTSYVNPFTSYTSNGLNRFESTSLRYWAHDLYDDGLNNGSILLKAFYNPVGSGNQSLNNSPGGQETLMWHLQNDYYSDGVINGNTLKDTFGQVYEKVTGHDISPQLNAYQNQASPMDYNSVMRNEPDPKTQAGFNQLLQQTGWSGQQVLQMSLWGHDAIDNFGPRGRNIDGSVLQASLTDPKSIDYPLVQAIPGAKSYVQGLINSNNPGQALNNDFLNTLFSTSYNQGGYNPWGGGGSYPGGYNPGGYPGGYNPGSYSGGDNYNYSPSYSPDYSPNNTYSPSTYTEVYNDPSGYGGYTSSYSYNPEYSSYSTSNQYSHSENYSNHRRY